MTNETDIDEANQCSDATEQKEQKQDGLGRATKRKIKHYERQKLKRQLKRANSGQTKPDDSDGGSSRSSKASDLGMFEIGIARDKGVGLFALRDIGCGTCVLREEPLLVTPLKWSIQRLLSSIRMLPKHALSQYTTLSYKSCNCSHTGPACRHYDEFLYSIWRINTFSCPRDRIGVYATASRINHSCTPNLMFSHEEDNDTMVAYATRDISAGEELTWSYIDVCQDFRNRAHDLEVACPEMGRCRCENCDFSSPSKMFRMYSSEKRRTRIADLIGLLTGLDNEESRQTKWNEMNSSAHELRGLLKEEGLIGQELAGAYHTLATLWAQRDIRVAEAWKRMELHILQTIFGTPCSQVEICEEELAALNERKQSLTDSGT